MDAALLAYLPMDRRHALSCGTTLPERTMGSALFADISGFTPLTEALTRALGARRGAEALPRHLNQVYDALIDQVHAYGGSVIGFAGDAITCWFDQDLGARATTCALAMQAAMLPFAELPLPSGEVASLAIKAAVAHGPVRRFLVGDPRLQVMEVLAGETLTRLAEVEHLAQKGEVVVEQRTAQALGGLLQITEWRRGEQDGAMVAVVVGMQERVAPAPWPALAGESLSEPQIRPWLLPTVYARLREGQGEFLTELRPAVALFLRFSGLDFDADEEAGTRLDRYLCWVQAILVRYEGTLLQLTMDDKGSYLYVAFGAPIAHEDDAERAVRAALELRYPPPELAIASVQVGISRGTMRTGAYGGTGARTYGSLGDEVNLAARLMQQAEPGQVLASGRIQEATEVLFHWQALSTVQLKGKSERIPLFALVGERPRPTIHLQEPHYPLPMVGRQAELAQIEAQMEQALAGWGQLVGITGEAGMGKSRLVAEVVQRASARGLVGYGGECQSYGTNMPYLVWQPIWRTLFHLEPGASLGEQEATVRDALEAIDPALLPRLPLLGPVLGLPLADTELVKSFDAGLRKRSREAMLVDVLRARAEQAHRQGSALLLVLEDVHWLDPLSHDLLEAIGQASTTMALLVVLAYRPPELTRLQSPRVTRLPHFSEARLTELPPAEMRELIQRKLGQPAARPERPVPERLLQQVLARAEGLPFYAEELLNYLHDQGLDPWEGVPEALELPSSLHSLVLSRMDQLSETQKITVKVASIIGRVFSFRWLVGYYPALGEAAQVRANLEELRRLDLTPLEAPEPELTYLFKHIVTQEVAYESLTYEQRATLHEQFAAYLESDQGERDERHLELLTYHYGRSENLPKKRAYLRRAAEVAQGVYANEAAIDYYEHLLPLLDESERVGVLLPLGEVLRLIGRYDEAEGVHREALELSQRHGDALAFVRCLYELAKVHEVRADYNQALTWLAQAETSSQQPGLSRERSLILNLKGHVLCRMGSYAPSLEVLAEALALAEAQQDHVQSMRALLTMSHVYLEQGSYAEAEQCGERALRLGEVVNDKVEIGRSLNLLASVFRYRSDFITMMRYQEEALALEKTIGNKRGIAVNLFNLAWVYVNQEDYLAAQGLYEESLRLFRELDDKYGTNACLSALGVNAHDLRDDRQASELLEEALVRVRAGRDKRQVTNVLINLTEVRLAQSNVEEARFLIEEALKLAEEMGDKRTMMRAHGQLGRVAWLQGDFASARGHYLVAFQLVQVTEEKQYLCEILSALAGLNLAEQGSLRSSVCYLGSVQASLAQFRANLSRNNGDILEEILQLARAQLSEDDFNAAWAEGQAMSLDEAVTLALAEQKR